MALTRQKNGRAYSSRAQLTDTENDALLVVTAVAAVGATAVAVFYLKKCRQRQQERRESVTSAVSKQLSKHTRRASKRPSQDSGQSHNTDTDDLVATAGALDPFAVVQSRHNPM